MSLKIGIGRNLIGIGGGSIPLPDPDALFDTRTVLNITDSIGGENLTIKGFPFWYNTESTAGLILQNRQNLFTPASGDLTAIYFIRPFQGTVNYTDFRGIADYGNNYIRIYHSTKKAYFFFNGVSNNATFPDNGNYITNLYMLVARYNNAGTLLTCRLYNTSTNYAQTTVSAAHHAAAAYGLRVENTVVDVNVGYIKSYYYTRELSDAEITAVWNGTASTNSLISYIAYNIGESLQFKGYDSVSNNEWVIRDATGNQPATPYMVRENLIQMADNLLNGYTQRGLYQIAYTPGAIKGITGLVGDIECPSTTVIHNLADSRIYCDGITDVTIKAIFDKSNTTYWKASIQAEDHYIDAGGGYYGVWHPSQLNRTFIEAHAEAGHENHIFPGLRLSGTAINGITEIAVFKTNV